MTRAMGRSFQKLNGQSSQLCSAIAIQLQTYLKWRADFTSAIVSGCWPMLTIRLLRCGRGARQSRGKNSDMSLCYLRSVSPIHLQYLKNMGVGATLSCFL